MIVNQKALLDLKPVVPMESTKQVSHDKKGRRFSYGLTECGYDLRIAQTVTLFYGKRFVLASSFEFIDMPDHCMGRILNKSTLARMGLDFSRTTNVEPGWRGFLTFEITYSKMKPITIYEGTGVAQLILEQIQEPVVYAGKYQDQEYGPVAARF